MKVVGTRINYFFFKACGIAPGFVMCFCVWSSLLHIEMEKKIEVWAGADYKTVCSWAVAHKSPPNQLRLAECARSPQLDKNGTELKSSTTFVALSHDQSPSLCMQYTFWNIWTADELAGKSTACISFVFLSRTERLFRLICWKYAVICMYVWTCVWLIYIEISPVETVIDWVTLWMNVLVWYNPLSTQPVRTCGSWASLICSMLTDFTLVFRLQ